LRIGAPGLVVVVETNVHITVEGRRRGRPRSSRTDQRRVIQAAIVNPEKAGEGQDVAEPFIKESTEGEWKLWRKKMSLEKGMKKRV